MLKDNRFKALLDLNILYKSKYYDLLLMDHAFYGMHVLGPYVKRIKAKMSRRELFNYWVYKKAKGITIGRITSPIPGIRGQAIKTGPHYHWSKKMNLSEFSDLYYHASHFEDVRDDNAIWGSRIPFCIESHHFGS